MKILVTGGAGFLGGFFARDCVVEGLQVTVLDALTYASNISNIPEEANFIHGDVSDQGAVDDIINEFDFIVHFAAETHVARSISSSRVFIESDVLGTHAVLEAFRRKSKHKSRLIHISSSEVYGTNRDVVSMMDEDHPLNPMGPYAAAKCAADRLASSYIATYGLNITILRPFNVFGPRQHLEKLIPRMMSSALLNEPMTVHGLGAAQRDYTYVTDVVRAIMGAMLVPSTKGGVYNIASGVTRSVGDIARDVRDAMHLTDAKIKLTPDRPGQVANHWGDARRLTAATGWRPVTSWEQGLESTAQWYFENPRIWQAQLRTRLVEIEKSGLRL